MTDWALIEWAYALLGLLVGIIFVLDGWRSPPDSSQSLRQSPKLRGLLFVLGAGVIPVIQTLAAKDPGVLALYSLWFVASTLALLLALSLYATVVAYFHLQEVHPNQSKARLVIKALPLTMITLQNGLPSFQTRLDNLMVRTLVGQRNWAIDFHLGSLEALVKYFLKRKPQESLPVHRFTEFSEHFLALVLTNILEGSATLENYRASIYCLPSGGNELFFLTGFAPETAPHTKRKLPLEQSLAGWALRNPPRVHEARIDGGRGGPTFHPPDRAAWYKSVAAVAIRPFSGDARVEPQLVLCIDSKRESILGPLDYNRRMIFALSVLLGNAATSMGIDGAALEAEVRMDGA